LFAETVTPCELRFLSADRLHELRREFPVINEALIIYLARSTRTLISFIEQSTFLPMLGRVAARLGFLVDEAEARGESVSTLKIPQKDIGLMVGASRQAVNKALSALQQQGVLTTQYGAVLIKDVARLRALGEGVGDVTEADLPQDMM
jgi:CRP-like cAMP-binding protein